jgi:putative Mn2+ efflux pump MntP
VRSLNLIRRTGPVTLAEFVACYRDRLEVLLTVLGAITGAVSPRFPEASAWIMGGLALALFGVFYISRGAYRHEDAADYSDTDAYLATVVHQDDEVRA